MSTYKNPFEYEQATTLSPTLSILFSSRTTISLDSYNRRATCSWLVNAGRARA